MNVLKVMVTKSIQFMSKHINVTRNSKSTKSEMPLTCRKAFRQDARHGQRIANQIGRPLCREGSGTSFPAIHSTHMNKLLTAAYD